jgi:tripartite-type tricarboxylate transporter receptor subunit TctC
MKTMASTALLLLTSLLISATASGEDYPRKPIRFLVPFAPGGGADFTARVYGKYLSEIWGQTVVVDNRPGAGSNIGTRAVAQATADGYTILVTSTAFAVNPALYRNAGYDPVREFAPIVNGGYSPTILFVHPSVSANTLKDLIALSKSQKLSYASAGIGTVPFLTVEYLLNARAKMGIVHVPYGGAGPALQAVIGGHVQVGAATFATPSLAEWFKTGKLKPIVIMTAQRNKTQPDVPTASESGYPGYVDSTWQGIFAPAGTPREVVAKLNQAMVQGMTSQGVREALTKVGFEFAPNTAEQFAAYVKSEVARWAEAVKETGAHAD